jgi:hypothetical protein
MFFGVCLVWVGWVVNIAPPVREFCTEQKMRPSLNPICEGGRERTSCLNIV